MDTSGEYPQLSDDDPIWEVSAYTQTMRTKLQNHRRMEFKTNSPFAVAANSPWDVGPLSLWTNNPYRTTGTPFANTTGAASGTIKITESGFYVVSCYVIPTGDPGPSWAALETGPNGIGRFAQAGNNSKMWESMVNAPVPVYVAAGDYIRGAYVASNPVSINTTLTIYKAWDYLA